MLTLPAAPLLPTWAALRLHATYLRRTIRANRCTYSCPEDINSEGRVEAPAVARCPKENPDAPDEWCDNCNRRATARAELAAVKKDIRATERKMLRALNNEVSNG